MKKTIKWGIVGAGNIANKFAKAVKNVDGAALTCVASTSEKRGKEFADKYDIENVFTSYEEMAKSETVDAVYIATVHTFHKPCAEIFLNAKKHVLCEKPICIDANQATELMQCASKNGVFLMEAMWTRFLPAIKEAVKVASGGEIGEIRGVKADFCYSVFPDEDPKLFRSDMAGGSLLDVGVYGLNFASIFLGDNPESIAAVADIDKNVDLQTNILMKYPSGAVASVSSAINVLKPETGYIYGTKGYIEIPHFYGAQELIVNTESDIRHISKPSIGDGFEEEIIEACSCIKSGLTQSSVMPMTQSIRILELTDQIREQIKLNFLENK